MTTPLTLSAVQYEALEGGTAANLAEHIRLIEDADSHGSRLVIFPELSLTGYALEPLADPGQWLTAADGRLDGIREICRRTGITAVVGAPYKEPDGTRGWPPSQCTPPAVWTAASRCGSTGRRLDLQLGARAMDHRTYSVLVNLGGSTPFGPSAGKSGFRGPDGFVLRQAAGTGTEVLTATLQHPAARI